MDTFDQTRWWRLKQTVVPIISESETARLYLIGKLLKKRSEPGDKSNSGHKFRGGGLAAQQVGVERGPVVQLDNY